MYKVWYKRVYLKFPKIGVDRYKITQGRLLVCNGTSGYPFDPTISSNIMVLGLLLIAMSLDWEVQAILNASRAIGIFGPGLGHFHPWCTSLGHLFWLGLWALLINYIWPRAISEWFHNGPGHLFNDVLHMTQDYFRVISQWPRSLFK